MNTAKKILVIAGEASGDLHAAKLVKALHAKNADIEWFAMGSHHLRAAGAHMVVDSTRLAIVGIVEVLVNFRLVYAAFKRLRRVLKQQHPDLIVLVDYPGFNLKFAKYVKRRGFKVLYYISPQIWAWHKSRIKTLKKYVDHMAVIFPFEVELYQRAGVPVTYVGHPLTQHICPRLSITATQQKFSLQNNVTTLAILPGSRKSEIKRLLPVMTETVRLLKQDNPSLQVILPLAHTLTEQDVEPYLNDADIKVISGYTYELLQLCQAAIVASGTATLETALLKVPMVITYKINPLTYALGKYIVNIQTVGLCNIVAGKKVAQEFIQGQATANNIATETKRLLSDKVYQATIKAELDKIHTKLGHVSDDQHIDSVVMKMLQLK